MADWRQRKDALTERYLEQERLAKVGKKMLDEYLVPMGYEARVILYPIQEPRVLSSLERG